MFINTYMKQQSVGKEAVYRKVNKEGYMGGSREKGREN